MTDQSKLEKLFRQHYRQMYRLATILLHDDAESKDVVHDIFAHLLDDPKGLKEDTAEHYLLTCVRNRCLNMIRSRKIQERVEHLYLLDLDTTILPTERLDEEVKALQKGIDVPLGEIFEELSGYYNVKVVYQNEDAPRLRLFYQWKPEYTLEKVVEMLNNFEWIQIQKENDTLFIRTTAIPAKDC